MAWPGDDVDDGSRDVRWPRVGRFEGQLEIEGPPVGDVDRELLRGRARHPRPRSTSLASPHDPAVRGGRSSRTGNFEDI